MILHRMSSSFRYHLRDKVTADKAFLPVEDIGLIAAVGVVLWLCHQSCPHRIYPVK